MVKKILKTEENIMKVGIRKRKIRIMKNKT
jgi:hypothetical protein